MITVKTKEFDIPFNQLDVTPEKVLKFLNIQDSHLYDHSRDSLLEFIENALPNAKVKGGFVFIEKGRIKFGKNNFIIDNTIFQSEKIITSRLKKSDSAAIFAATAGEYFELESKKLIAAGDTFMGYLIDAAASEVAESAAEWVENKIMEYAGSQGLNTTSRYSPGYCGWNVVEQHKLFSFLPQNFCGIRLTDSALMIPIKSVSGIIGVGQDVRKEEYECAICDDVNCFRRNI